MDSDNRGTSTGGLKPLPKPVKLASPKRAPADQQKNSEAAAEKIHEQVKPAPVKIESSNYDAYERVRPASQYPPYGNAAGVKQPQHGGGYGQTQRQSSNQHPRAAQNRYSSPGSQYTFYEAFQIFVRRIFKRKPRGRSFYQKNSMTIGRITGIAAVIILAAVMLSFAVWSFVNKNAFAVSLNGNLIGYVAKSIEIDEAAIHSRAVAHLETSIGARVQVNETVGIQLVHASRRNLVAFNELIADVSRSFTYKIAAVALMVEGVEIVVLKTEAEAEAVFKFLTEPYTLDDVNYVYINFVESWDTHTKLTDIGELGTKDDALKELDRTVRTTTGYTVVEGDTLWTIATRFNTTIDKICDENGITRDTVIRPGDVYEMEITKPFLSVKTIEEIIKKEQIQMPVRQNENPFEDTSYFRVIEEGRDGEREVTVRVTRINGVQQGQEEIINTLTTIVPIDRVVEVGTSNAQSERRYD